MNPLMALISPVLDKVLSFIPNPAERAKAEAEATVAIMQAIQQNDLAQAEVNKIEASSSNLFVSGWRPFVGWVCGAGVAWTFVIQPFVDWILAIVRPGITTPVLDASQLMSLLFGMLGLGAMRSFDKMKGTSK